MSLRRTPVVCGEPTPTRLHQVLAAAVDTSVSWRGRPSPAKILRQARVIKVERSVRLHTLLVDIDRRKWPKEHGATYYEIDGVNWEVTVRGEQLALRTFDLPLSLERVERNSQPFSSSTIRETARPVMWDEYEAGNEEGRRDRGRAFLQSKLGVKPTHPMVA